MNILVIDVGTSSMRGILYSQEGKELTISQKKYNVMYLKSGWVEQNPSDWEYTIYDILKDIVRESKLNNWEIGAISLTSQRSSVIPVDHMIKPIGNAIMWQDKRTNYICEKLAAKNDMVFNLSGARVNPVFSASKMTWIRENNPELYSRVYKFMVVPDYLIYLLTGEICTDYTYGSRSLLMNIRSKEWDEELLSLFNVEKDKLCKLIEPGSICGNITKYISDITGLSEGIPVITAGGDQQCGAVGQGVVKEGSLSVTVGTGGFLIAASDKVPKELKQDVICNVSAIKNQYVLESSILTCCSAFDWFCNTFYDEWNYEKVNSDIEKSPIGANNCVVIPYFQGRSTPDWNNEAKGTFSNITLNTSRYDMLRGLLEGICYEIDNGIKVMKSYVNVSEIYINGGLTNSEPFNKMQVNVYDTKLIRRGKDDATARGALMIAATTLGIYKGIEEAFDNIGVCDDTKIYIQNPQYVQAYKKHRNQMNVLYKKIYEEKRG